MKAVGAQFHQDLSSIVTEQGRGWFMINYYRKDSPFLSLEVPSPTPTCEVRNARRQRKDVSQCQRLVKRKGIVYLKVTQT